MKPHRRDPTHSSAVVLVATALALALGPPAQAAAPSSAERIEQLRKQITSMRQSAMTVSLRSTARQVYLQGQLFLGGALYVGVMKETMHGRTRAGLLLTPQIKLGLGVNAVGGLKRTDWWHDGIPFGDGEFAIGLAIGIGKGESQNLHDRSPRSEGRFRNVGAGWEAGIGYHANVKLPLFSGRSKEVRLLDKAERALSKAERAASVRDEQGTADHVAHAERLTRKVDTVQDARKAASAQPALFR